MEGAGMIPGENGGRVGGEDCEELIRAGLNYYIDHCIVYKL